MGQWEPWPFQAILDFKNRLGPVRDDITNKLKADPSNF